MNLIKLTVIKSKYCHLPEHLAGWIRAGHVQGLQDVQGARKRDGRLDYGEQRVHLPL